MDVINLEDDDAEDAGGFDEDQIKAAIAASLQPPARPAWQEHRSAAHRRGSRALDDEEQLQRALAESMATFEQEQGCKRPNSPNSPNAAEQQHHQQQHDGANRASRLPKRQRSTGLASLDEQQEQQQQEQQGDEEKEDHHQTAGGLGRSGSAPHAGVDADAGSGGELMPGDEDDDMPELLSSDDGGLAGNNSAPGSPRAAGRLRRQLAVHGGPGGLAGLAAGDEHASISTSSTSSGGLSGEDAAPPQQHQQLAAGGGGWGRRPQQWPRGLRRGVGVGDAQVPHCVGACPTPGRPPGWRIYGRQFYPSQEVWWSPSHSALSSCGRVVSILEGDGSPGQPVLYMVELAHHPLLRYVEATAQQLHPRLRPGDMVWAKPGSAAPAQWTQRGPLHAACAAPLPPSAPPSLRQQRHEWEAAPEAAPWALGVVLRAYPYEGCAPVAEVAFEASGRADACFFNVCQLELVYELGESSRTAEARRSGGAAGPHAAPPAQGPAAGVATASHDAAAPAGGEAELEEEEAGEEEEQAPHQQEQQQEQEQQEQQQEQQEQARATPGTAHELIS